ncbi:MAG: aldehyde dehydrogenase family protein, partial [Saprospiraceae bacterium]|nr:aldehyde dehydrogenase family protein [Saprospiraceae bacterium]
MQSAVTHAPAEVQNFVDGQFKSVPTEKLDVLSPLDGQIISTVPLSGFTDLDEAVQAAKKAFPAWSALTLKERVQFIFRYRNLLIRDREDLSALIQLENGKTLDEARAEVDKSIELC